MLIGIVILVHLVGARTLTGLQVCAPENAFFTVFERESRSPLLGIYGGWLGWLNDVDRRDEDVPPTHVYLIVLPTAGRSHETLLWKQNGRSALWDDIVSRPVAHVRYPSVSEIIDFGLPWSVYDPKVVAEYHRPPPRYWLVSSELTPAQLESWSATGRLPVRFDEIVVRETDVHTGAVDFELCGVAAPPRRQKPAGGVSVGVCMAPFSPFWVWASTFKQFVAWYALHHDATILLSGRPEDGEAMREFVRPFVAAHLATFEIVRWPDLPTAWLTGGVPFSHLQSPWRRFQNSALTHQCLAKHRDHFDWILRIDFDEYLAISGNGPPSTSLPSMLTAMPRAIEKVAFAMIAHRAQVNALAFNTTVFETFLRVRERAFLDVLPATINSKWNFWIWKMAIRTNATLGFYSAHGALDVTNSTAVLADPNKARLLHAMIGEAPIPVVRKWEVNWTDENVRMRQLLPELDVVLRSNLNLQNA